MIKKIELCIRHDILEKSKQTKLSTFNLCVSRNPTAENSRTKVIRIVKSEF